MNHGLATNRALQLLALILLAASAQAQPGVTVDTDGVTLVAERGNHATIELSPENGDGFLLSGTLLDAEAHPLVGVELRIVRFKVTRPSTTHENVADLVPLDQLNGQVPPFVIERTISLVTKQDGRFRLKRALPSGRYSLQLDWNEVPEGSVIVRFDLRWEERHRTAVVRQ